MALNQGLSAASRILPIIDQKNSINDSDSASPIKIDKSDIEFTNVIFAYEVNEGVTLNSVNLNFKGVK